MGRILSTLCLGLLLVTGCGGDSDATTEPAASKSGEPRGQPPAAGPPEAAAPAGRPEIQPRELPPVQELYQAVQSNPEDYRTRHLFGLALHRAGRREEALEQFQMVVAQRPDTVYLIELGVAYASLSRMEESESAFERALEGAPGNPVVLHHLGNLAQRRGETAQAISLYRQAIENDPKYLMAHFQLGESLRRSGQAREAYRSYETVVGLNPRTPPEVNAFDAALFHLANLDLQMGATERGIEFLKVLVEAVPDHPSAHLLLGQALAKLGREEEAKKALAVHQQLSARRSQAQAAQAESP